MFTCSEGFFLSSSFLRGKSRLSEVSPRVEGQQEADLGLNPVSEGYGCFTSCWPCPGGTGFSGPVLYCQWPPGWAALCRNSLLMLPATPVSRHPLAQIIPSVESDVSEGKGLGKESSSLALATDSKDTEPLQASVYSLVNQRG